MKRLGWLAVGVACAACCAPLLPPLLAAVGLGGLGGALAGWVGGLGVSELICLAGFAALGAGAVVWLLRRRRSEKAVSCEIGGPSDPGVLKVGKPPATQ